MQSLSHRLRSALTFSQTRRRLKALLEGQPLGVILSRLCSSSLRGGALPEARRLKPTLETVPVLRRRERGQALIEMILVLPLIFVFILVLVDFGIALDRRELIQHAVREGARAGAVGASEAEIIEHTVLESAETLAPEEVSVCYVDGGDGNSSPGDAGDSVRVSANYTYRFTVGGGEMLTVFRVPVPSINMSPWGEARLETFISGAKACP